MEMEKLTPEDYAPPFSGWAHEQRDPAKWFAHVTCNDNIPRVFGTGSTKAEAVDRCHMELLHYGKVRALPFHLYVLPPDSESGPASQAIAVASPKRQPHKPSS